MSISFEPPMQIIVCDPETSTRERLIKALNCHELVESVIFTDSLAGVRDILAKTEIDAIFIDPLQLDPEPTANFIFSVRESMPEIIFALYVDVKEVRKRDIEFYQGERLRFMHYFKLDKCCPAQDFQKALTETLHFCMSDRRLQTSVMRAMLAREYAGGGGPPVEIKGSLAKFHQVYPIKMKTSFIMMQFGDSPAHRRITRSIQDSLRPIGIKALRADEREFHPDLYYNVLTYIHGCTFGIAVFERIIQEEFNPNVSLEVGYMMGLRKPICLLKDQTLKTLQIDLIGKLYRSFDIQNPEESISVALQGWIADRAFPWLAVE